MNKIFKEVQFTDLIKQGEVYILTEYGYKLEKACALYTIRTDQEALLAADLHMHIYCMEDNELKGYLGVEAIDEDAYAIRFLCHDIHAKEDFEVKLVLERLKSFQEEFDRLKEWCGLE